MSKVGLLDKENRDESIYEMSGNVDREFFTDLFKIANIQDGTSLKKLQRLGGE